MFAFHSVQPVMFHHSSRGLGNATTNFCICVYKCTACEVCVWEKRDCVLKNVLKFSLSSCRPIVASYASGYPTCQMPLVGIIPIPHWLQKFLLRPHVFQTLSIRALKSQWFSDIRLEVSDNSSHKTRYDLIAIWNGSLSWGDSQVPTRWWKDALWESTVSAVF